MITVTITCDHCAMSETARHIGIKYIQLLTITKQDIYLTIPVDGETVSVTALMRTSERINKSVVHLQTQQS